MRKLFTKENITKSIMDNFSFSPELANEIVQHIWHDDNAQEESPAISQLPHSEIADLDSWRRRYGAFLSQNSDCLTELCEIYEAIRKYLMQHSPVR